MAAVALEKEGEMNQKRFRPIGTLFALCLIVALAAAAVAGAATQAPPMVMTPAAGTIQLFTTGGSSGPILITGAIGDYGKTLNINKYGKADSNGTYVKVTLKKGGFEINAAALNAKLNKLNPPVNKATCSAVATATGPVTLFDGTGLYAGISGTIHITVTFAIVLPTYASGKDMGQCNMSNSAQPLDQMGLIRGTGKVSFS